MHELIAPTLNFTILVVLLTYFLRKPVKDMVAARRTSIKSQVDEAQIQKTEAEKKYREFSAKLSSFEAEAQAILERATQDGETIKAKIIREAQATAERIVRDSEATVMANLQEYKDQIRKETIAKAVDIAEKTIRDRFSADDHKRIVTEYVGKVGSP